MPSPELINIEALLAPIPGDQPAGSSIPFEIRHQLEEGRKQDDPENWSTDDPMRPQEFKKADWAGIVRLAQDTLTQTSKDLLVAARLTEALVREHGFAGLRDGLRLLRGLLDQCWDRLHPPLEDGDLAIRASPFIWLEDPIRGARFPTTLSQVPLLIGKKASYSWQHCDQSLTNKLRIPRDELDKAIQDASREQLAAVNEDVSECLAELERLRTSLNARLKKDAPGLGEVEKVLESCRLFVQHALRQCPDAAAETDNTSEESRPTAGPSAPSAALSTRAEAYRQLAQAAARLRELEPHSPIPYLVQRAVELGNLPFPQLMKALIRDVNVLAELNREFGIKESSSETSNES